MIYFKNEMAATALLLSLIPAAQANTCFGGDCGIVFDTPIPDMPALTTEFCPSSRSSGKNTAPRPHNLYTLENQGSTDVVLDFTLTELDSLDDPTAVQILESSHARGLDGCQSGNILEAGDSCDLTLTFQPCVTGELNWNLNVIPDSTQRPLVLNLMTSVTTYVPVTANYAYVVNNGADQNISSCEMTGGNFGSGDTETSCETVSFTVEGDADPGNFYSIAFNAENSFAYLSSSSNTVTVCPVIDALTFGSEDVPCIIQTDPDFNTMLGLAYYDAGDDYAKGSDGDILYAVSSVTDVVVACPILENGTLDTCDIAASSPPNSTDISLNDDGTYAYVTNAASTNTVSVFSVSGTSMTLLESLSDATIPSPYGVLVFDGTVFVSNIDDDSLAACAIDGDDGFSLDFPCSVVDSASFLEPAGIAEFNSRLYITDMSGQVTKCNSSFVCTALTDPSFNTPTDVAFLADEEAP